MNLGDYLVPLAPELILLIGACITLIAGVAGSSQRRGQWVSPLTLLIVLAALAGTLAQGVPDNVTAIPGLWLTSLTFYTRCITLGIGALIVLVNWHQPVAQERGEYMAMILFSLLLDRFTLPTHLTLRRQQQASDNTQQAGLTGPVGATHVQQLAWFKRKAQAIQ